MNENERQARTLRAELWLIGHDQEIREAAYAAGYQAGRADAIREVAEGA